jgi:hypothetical protein
LLDCSSIWQIGTDQSSVVRTPVGIAIQRDVFPALGKLPLYCSSSGVSMHLLREITWPCHQDWWGHSGCYSKDQVQCTAAEAFSTKDQACGLLSPFFPDSQGGLTEEFSWNVWKLIKYLKQMKGSRVTYPWGDGDVWIGALTTAEEMNMSLGV